MSVYIGLIVLDTIKNRIRFNETINEIKHFLQTYQEELNSVTKPLITIKPKFGGSEASFPTNNNYFHTTYFRIRTDNKPSEDIKLYAYVVWECCCIFKENFPSKVEIFQENLDSISSFMKTFSYDEILRRQISTLNSKKYSNEAIKHDEVEDIFCILETALKRKNSKGIAACLNTLNSPNLCPVQSLHNLSDRYIKVVEVIASTSSNQQDYELDDEKSLKEIELNRIMASNLLNKIMNAQKVVVEEQDPNVSTPFKDVGNTMAVKTSVNFEKPFSVKTCLFQLNESNDINRIVFLLDNIINSHFAKILQSYSYNLFSIISKIIQRYSNGDFGFDNNENTKYCILQNRLLKCLLALIESKPELVNEIDVETINLLSQIMEECCLYIIQNLSNSDRKHEYEYKLFFQQSIKLFELLISNHQINNIQEVINSIKSIIERIKMYFSSYPSEEDLDLEEMAIFYNDLKSYYEDVRGLLKKTETLADLVLSTAKKRTVKPSYTKENMV